MTNENSIQNQGKGLNIFEKYLTLWVALCIAGGIVLGKLESHGEHGGAVKCHPGGTVGLFQMTARRQWLGAIEHADVVQTEEAAGKQVPAADVFAVDPPGEIQQQLGEHAL